MAKRVSLNHKLATPAGRASFFVVCLLAIVMVALLYRTQSNAASIRQKTAAIAASGRGINDSTDSIIQLNKTNDLAAAIVKAVRPLPPALASISESSAQIDRGLGSIQESSSSIDSSAAQINTSASSVRTDVDTVTTRVGQINTTLNGVNANAAAILNTATTLERGIGLINSNLARAEDVVRHVLQDAQGINVRLGDTNHLASCIDNGLNGGATC